MIKPNEIKVALANAELYEKGDLIHKWVTLPVTLEEFESVKQEVGKGSNNIDNLIIADFEAPFEIKTNDSISRINELARSMKDCPRVDFENDSLFEILKSIRGAKSKFHYQYAGDDYFALREIEQNCEYPITRNGSIDFYEMKNFVKNIKKDTEVVYLEKGEPMVEVTLSDLKDYYYDLVAYHVKHFKSNTNSIKNK